MFGNLKNKLEDVADLKKYAAPQAISSLIGSRQRSSQHTPVSQTPSLSRHSRESSVTSLQNVDLVSEPSAKTIKEENIDKVWKSKDMVNEKYEKEIEKLKRALESQQNEALNTLLVKEQEWKIKLENESSKASALESKINEIKKREKKIFDKMKERETEAVNIEAKAILKNAKIKELEGKLANLQENFDQLEGLGSQEASKVKHLLLSTSKELENANNQLEEKNDKIESLEKRISLLSNMEDRVKSLSDEKMEHETKIAGLQKKLKLVTSRIENESEQHCEEVKHLEEKISLITRLNSQDSSEENEKTQILISERDEFERCLEQSREQFNSAKLTWNNKILVLENQIENLNTKISEDQCDLADTEKTVDELREQIQMLHGQNTQQGEEFELVKKLHEEKVTKFEEDIELITNQYEMKLAKQQENFNESKKHLECSMVEKDKEIVDLRRALHLGEEKSKQLKETIDSLNSENIELKNKISEFENASQSLSECNSMLEDKNTFLQSSYSTMQDNLNQERKCTQLLQEECNALKLKLETLSSEKVKLSSNLDGYLEKVNHLEEQQNKLQEELSEKSEIIDTLQSNVRQYEMSNSELALSLKEYETEFERKVEESDLVLELRGKLKTFEDDLEEKKQMIKVQSQRLADMKKTLQRELKRNVDNKDLLYNQSGSNQPSPRGSVNEWRPAYSDDPSSAHIEHNGTENAELVNIQYLRHVIIKFLTLKEYEAVHLTRAVSTLLRMTPEEENLLKETLEYRNSWFGMRPQVSPGQLGKPTSHHSP